MHRFHFKLEEEEDVRVFVESPRSLAIIEYIEFVLTELN